jgi:hypothetical protein
MKYTIEYSFVPTLRNPTLTIETDNLELFVHVSGHNSLSFTNYAKQLNCIHDKNAVIERIYQDNKETNELNVLYKSFKHFSEKLSGILKDAPKEIFI